MTFKKRLILVFSLTVILLLVTSCITMPFPTPSRGTVLSLPFPVASDAPVGVSSAEIRISWEDTDRLIDSVYDYLSYRGMFTAEYTIRFDGDEPANIKIAQPIPVARATFEEDYDREIFVHVDGIPVEVVGYMVRENITHTGTENLAGINTPILETFMRDARFHIDDGIFAATVFDCDAPATLHTFAVDVPHGVGLQYLRIYFRYDHERTAVVYSTSSSQGLTNQGFTPRYNSELGLAEIRNSMRFSRGADDAGRGGSINVHLLLMGEDTLTWDYELSFWDGARPVEIPNVFTFVDTNYETPRNYFRQFQEGLLLDRHTGINIDPDLLMRWVDNNVANDTRFNFANLNRFVLPRNPNAIVVEIPFESGQERVFSISFPVHSSGEWNRESDYSLFHHTILTEMAQHWDFFESLTIIANHPENIEEYALPEGFETFNNYSAITLQNPSDNVNLGFVLPDERETPSVFRLLIVAAAIIAIPVVVAAVILFLIVGAIGGGIVLILKKKSRK
ncbi:MAG: hypothetical protein FWC89_02115 [Defluviitaleaceae bacterium]|nr:hypothetical protein [Defluviitaleaceae bacterium]